jgi:hypothetical protein
MPTDQMYVVGSAGGVTFQRSDSRFFAIGGALVHSPTEADLQLLARAAYTWSNPGARVISNNLDATSIIHARLNGVDQAALQISIGAGQTGFIEDATGSVSVADGDLINYRMATGTGVHGDTLVLGAVVGQLQHASLERPVMISSGNGVFSVGQGQSRFGPMVGGLGVDITSEAFVRIRLRQDVTFSNLRIRVLSNSTDNPSTVVFRDDGVDTALSISVGAGATGSFEDTDSVSVAAVSSVAYRVGAGAGMAGDSIELIHFTILMAGSVEGRILGAADGGPPSYGSGTRYLTLETLTGLISSTELDSQVEVPVALDVTDMFVEVTLNSLSTAATTIALRVGGVDSALDISIAAGNNGVFEDFSVVSLAVDDLVNWELAVAAGGSGTITVAVISLEQASPPAPDDMSWYAMYPQGIHRVGATRAY